MFNPFTIALEMQRRFIDMQVQAMELAVDYFEGVQGNLADGHTLNQLTETGMDSVKNWLRFWGVRD